MGLLGDDPSFGHGAAASVEGFPVSFTYLGARPGTSTRRKALLSSSFGQFYSRWSLFNARVNECPASRSGLSEQNN